MKWSTNYSSYFRKEITWESDVTMFTKEYSEEYARLSLEKLHDEKYAYIRKGESPDWQSISLEIGLEITRGISQYVGKVHSMFGKHLDYPEVEKLVKLHYAKFDANIMFEDNIINMIKTKGILDFNTHIKNVISAYQNKVKKLNYNYEIYPSNQLYIYAFQHFDKEAINECMKADVSKHRIEYDKVFVNCIDVLYVCDFKNNVILDQVNVENDMLMLFKTHTIKKVFGEEGYKQNVSQKPMERKFIDKL